MWQEEQKQVEGRILGSFNIPGKGRARNQGKSVPKPWDEMILGKMEWSSMLRGMVLILLRNLNSCGKLPEFIE